MYIKKRKLFFQFKCSTIYILKCELFLILKINGMSHKILELRNYDISPPSNPNFLILI